MNFPTYRIEAVDTLLVTAPREIPCKDMDLDCLPDAAGQVPFGNYGRCQCYAPDQGCCPFLPIDGS